MNDPKGSTASGAASTSQGMRTTPLPNLNDSDGMLVLHRGVHEAETECRQARLEFGENSEEFRLTILRAHNLSKKLTEPYRAQIRAVFAAKPGQAGSPEALAIADLFRERHGPSIQEVFLRDLVRYSRGDYAPDGSRRAATPGPSDTAPEAAEPNNQEKHCP